MKYFCGVVCLLVSFAFMPVAQAARTSVVDDDGLASATDCNSTVPAFSTIMPAVTAAAGGDTIKVCPGTYASETVSIPAGKDRLRFIGPRAGIPGPRRATASPATEASVGNPVHGVAFLTRSHAIVIDGFTIVGDTGFDNELPAEITVGHRIRNNVFRTNDAAIDLELPPNDFLTNVSGNLFALPTGSGIVSTAGYSDVRISKNTFTVVVGIALNGFKSDVRITRNRFVDSKLPIKAEAGILPTQVTIANNLFKDTDPSDNGAQEDSVTIEGAGVLVARNRFIDVPKDAISLRNNSSEVDIVRNIVNGAGRGLEVDGSIVGGVGIFDNVVRRSINEAILMEATTAGDVISGNFFSSPGNLDCADLSVGAATGGTANHWRNNVGADSAPAGICAVG